MLSVPDEASLHSLERELAMARVAFVPIREPDPPMNGALTAIGIVPMRKEYLRKHLGKLPLLR